MADDAKAVIEAFAGASGNAKRVFARANRVIGEFAAKFPAVFSAKILRVGQRNAFLMPALNRLFEPNLGCSAKSGTGIAVCAMELLREAA